MSAEGPCRDLMKTATPPRCCLARNNNLPRLVSPERLCLAMLSRAIPSAWPPTSQCHPSWEVPALVSIELPCADIAQINPSTPPGRLRTDFRSGPTKIKRFRLVNVDKVRSPKERTNLETMAVRRIHTQRPHYVGEEFTVTQDVFRRSHTHHKIPLAERCRSMQYQL
ncbi:hypothetical protein P171DRAFT_238613 [Karstenula rhodostoma CBS 690.94]|uniref:Uncharacterized protein n=1 Tax=Karstenula rhodostoma CBS 690.94 TaxID=1392251 RepID=A0A9P4PQ02_9PLEO|nr:hypothetical protein P171DRAFT_238613 [Karstenula rhodostoma CBS 690.94]